MTTFDAWKTREPEPYAEFVYDRIECTCGLRSGKLCWPDDCAADREQTEPEQ